MILYVNGDSHTAAAEAVNPHAFAEDDGDLQYLGRLPHPDNLAVSWGRLMADKIKAAFKCDAESAASNSRILRTTRDWVYQQSRDPREYLVVIQWTTWERAEWFIDGTYYQINASGVDTVPQDHVQRYKQFIDQIDWNECTERWHKEIWRLHEEFQDQGIRHLFFNGNNHFGSLDKLQRYNWGHNYIGPYDPAFTYDQWLKNRGHNTVAPNSWHFGQKAHADWSRFVLQYCIQNKLI